ncbi:MAG: hypothetical protein ACREKE_08645, partial [bacterium]
MGMGVKKARLLGALLLISGLGVSGARLLGDVVLMASPAPGAAGVSLSAQSVAAVEPGGVAVTGVASADSASVAVAVAPSQKPAVALRAPVEVFPSPAAVIPVLGANPGLTLTLPGRVALALPQLSSLSTEPSFSVAAAASYAGFSVRWRSAEKALELSSGGRLRARLVLGQRTVVLRRRLLHLPLPLAIVAGAPALDENGLRLLLLALGLGRASLNPVQVANPPGAASPVPQPIFSPGPAPAPGPAPLPQAASLAPVPTAHVAARPLTGARIRTVVIDAGHGGKDPG